MREIEGARSTLPQSNARQFPLRPLILRSLSLQAVSICHDPGTIQGAVYFTTIRLCARLIGISVGEERTGGEEGGMTTEMNVA